jgi:nucleoside-diphosphate-sugar epimerase
VTGASGFIGRAVVRRLRRDGVTVVCTARRAAHDVAPAPSWVTGDVTDADFVDRLVREVEPSVVFHLAGAVTGSRALEVVPETFATNLTATVNVLRSVTEIGCDRLVLIGSGDEPQGDDPPCSPYAAAKWAAGGYARMFHALYGTPVTTARPFMVYGPDQPDTAKLVPYVTTSLLRGETPTLSSGERRCDWVYIDDVVDALTTLATDPACIDREVDIGTGRLETVGHVARAINRLVGGDVELALGVRSDRALETEDVADVAETARLCGWSPSTTLDAGLDRTVAWYRRQLHPTGVA